MPRPPCAATSPTGSTPSFERAFGAALPRRARRWPAERRVDLRVNALKADRDKVLKALARFAPEPTPLSPIGVRLPAPEAPGRQPNVEAEVGAWAGLVRGAG